MKEKSGKMVDTEGTSGEKKEKPKFCFRCWKPGHKKEECKAQLLCKICLSTEHITAKCTVYKNPRPIANPVGYEADGLGFYHIPHAPLPQMRNDNRTALVKVEGGSLSIEQLVQELTRLIPERWNWQVSQVEKNSFVVPFPTKADLQRSVAFGKADIKNHGVSLLFEEWQEEDDGVELDTTWIRVFRLPKKLREYPVLWVIGSMLGVTQEVDMVTTDANNFGRVQVAVMDVDRIPKKLDVVIWKRFYHLYLQVEGRDPEPMLHNMELDGDGDQGNDNGDNSETDKKGDGDVQKENGAKEQLEKKDNAGQPSITDKQANDSKVAGAVLVEELGDMEDSDNMLRSSKYPNGNNAGTGWSEGVQGMNWANDLHVGLRGACGLSTCAHACVGGINPVAVKEAGLVAAAGPVNMGSHKAAPDYGMPLAAGHEGVRRAGLMGADGLEQARIKLGQRKEQTPDKRSRRREETADELMQERAERLKAKRNLDFSQGNLQGHILDENMVTFSEGGGKIFHTKSMPTFGGGHHGYLCQKRLEV